MPKVSVIIPAYNSARFIIKTIGSVLDQTFRDFEIIVIDDGSTDNTQEAIQAISDRRVRILLQENQGCAAARNRGLRAAAGEYVALLDADDTYLPEKLMLQTRYLDEHPEVGLVASGWRYVDMKGAMISEAHPWETIPNLETRTWLFACPVIVNGLLVRREWLEKVNYFDAKLRSSEDFDAWLRMAHAGCRMAWLPEIVCTYRLHDMNIARNAKLKRDTYIAMLDKFYSAPDLTDEEVSLKYQAYAHHYLEGAAREYAAGMTNEAARDIDQAIRLHPSVLANDGQQIVEMVVGLATSPFTPDPFRYTRMVFANLPDSASAVRQRKRDTLAQIAMFFLYEAHRRQNWGAIPHLAVQAAWFNPKWLLNRGFLSISVRSVMNVLAGHTSSEEPSHSKGAVL